MEKEESEIEDFVNLHKIHKSLLKKPIKADGVLLTDEDDSIENDLEDESGNVQHKTFMHYGKFLFQNFDDYFDVELDKTFYRVFINRAERVAWCNEIVSFDYNGIVLLKNPIHKETTEKFQDELYELPERYWLDTISNFKQKVLKKLRLNGVKVKSAKKPRGRQPKVYLSKATLWCIENCPKLDTDRRHTISLAYAKFKKLALTENPTITEKSFVKMVSAKWTKLDAKYRSQSSEFKRQNSKINYAKTEFRVSRNNGK